MSYIEEKIIKKLKTEVSLAVLVESSGITLKNTARIYLGHCPSHDDKSPGLVISPNTIQ